jgi:glycosyltransferase involved in cell wall biosynthesis
MNIGINLIGFLPGKIGGMETYIRSLLDQLQLIDHTDTFTLLCDEWNLAEFPILSPNFSLKVCNYSKPSLRRLVRSTLRKAIGVDILKAEPRYQNFDFVHHPFTVIRPEWHILPSILTFHDMQQEFYPEFFPPHELQRRNETYKNSVAASTRLIAISEHVKTCLIDFYDVSPDKIDVIYNGCGPEYRVIEDQEGMAAVKSRYGLDRPYLLYPAATWPHKNHTRLLKALKLMKDRYRFDGNLVLTGIAMQTHGEILEQIKRMGLQDIVKVLGYLPYHELPYLFNMARIMVFPSLFEGFGIPIAEAMACGCPVVCSNVTSIPEVIGDSGVMFDPNSPDEMAEKLWHVWNDDAKRKEMSESGIERAKQFRWENTARKTLDAYRKVGRISSVKHEA